MAAQENHADVVRYLLIHGASQTLATEVCLRSQVVVGYACFLYSLNLSCLACLIKKKLFWFICCLMSWCVSIFCLLAVFARTYFFPAEIIVIDLIYFLGTILVTLTRTKISKKWKLQVKAPKRIKVVNKLLQRRRIGRLTTVRGGWIDNEWINRGRSNWKIFEQY